jgi:serine/threonine-protein kinase
VLELVEGLTLADRLRTGPLRLQQALETAAEIASALESAHERGVIHRDLKPDNVAFTRDGRAKVLDFGIARSLTAGSPGRATTAAVTELGLAIGTAPYMSPEQARGEAADRQTDIWALGVTLYEMLTGNSPFKRNTSTETLACVLETQPNYEALPGDTPASVRRLIRRCLEKDRKRRFRDMGDVRLEIEDALAGLGVTVAGAATKRTAPLRAIAAGTALLAVLGLAGLGIRSLATSEPPSAPVVRLSVTGLERTFDYPFGTQGLAISPDGTQIAFSTGNNRISVRRLSDPQIMQLQTPNLDQGVNPFFAPDGASLGAGTLLRLPSGGGAATRIYDHTERSAGATWGPDGTIVFATSTGLYRVAADGGTPELLIRPNAESGELLYAWPHWLPNRAAVLFTIFPARGSIEAAQIAVLDLATRETRVVLTGGTSPRYAATGHLIYAARQRLFAVAFDPDSGTTSGPPVELRDIAVATYDDNGAAQFALAENGTLAFREPDAQGRPVRLTLSWADRAGNETPVPLEPNRYVAPRVSPDGGRIAFDIPGGANRDVWIFDVVRESLTRLSDGPTEDLLPLWAPDGRRVYFGSDRTGNMDIYSQVADGSSPARLEVAYPGFQVPSSVSLDGTTLISTMDFRDLAVVDLTQSKLAPLLQSNAIEWLGELSPDGRWLAYDSNESGQFEVYLRPFPDVTSARTQVSAGGGGFPRWGPPGSNELYYVAADGAMMAASVELEPALRVGRPSKLFQYSDRITLGAGGRPYDVANDGRFLVPRVFPDDTSQSVNVTVILNWFEELREQVPVPE